MLENGHRISDLLDQYLNKTISEKDFTELFNYISKKENQQLLDDYMKKSARILLPAADVHEVDWQHMYDDIVSERKQNKSKIRILMSFGKRLGIAASLALIIFVGYQLYHKQIIINFGKDVKEAANQSLKPDNDRAILKLADGSQIILKDSQTGVLTKQGGSKIRKNNKGFIEYDVLNGERGTQVYINTLSTPRGGKYKLMLPDKTIVYLNAESSITFPTAFTKDKREVSVSGELYFEVSKDKSKPFIVENDNTKIQVLGTHFNVNAYQNEKNVAITLLEGSISLSRNGSSKILIPGQQALINKDSETINLRNVDADMTIDWKNGLFIFEDARIEEVMREIERWYDVDVKYEGKIPDIKFNGIISRGYNLSKILKLLGAAAKINFVTNDKKIVVKQINN